MKSRFLNILLSCFILSSCLAEDSIDTLDFDIGRVDILVDNDDWFFISINNKVQVNCVFKYSNGVDPNNIFMSLNTSVAKAFSDTLFDEVSFAKLSNLLTAEGSELDGRRVIIVLYDTQGKMRTGCHLSKGYADSNVNKLVECVSEMARNLQGFKEIKPKDAIASKGEIEKNFQSVVLQINGNQ